MELLAINKENNSVLYLGYTLALSPTEFSVLCAIAESERPLRRSELLRVLPSKNEALTSGNVSVHVSNINRKAKIIGGRTLILHSRSLGYSLSEFL